MNRLCYRVLVATVASSVAAAGCTSNNGSATKSSTPENKSVTVRGNATLDGSPFDAQFLGAVVLRGGLVTPCQDNIPPVVHGRYTVKVLADTQSSGCGAPGARIALWTFVQQNFVYTSSAVIWPRNGRVTNFTATFATATPAGVAPTTAQFSGQVFRQGLRLSTGRIEAYVGNTRCGVASVRPSGSFTGFVVAVVGPDSIAGCTRGATLMFRVNGRPATNTPVVNTPARQHGSLDLTVS
jgi:hypothetical protein